MLVQNAARRGTLTIAESADVNEDKGPALTSPLMIGDPGC